MNKKELWTIEDFLDILECYRLWILKSGEEFPTVVLSDIEASTRAILRNFGYDKRVKKYMEGKQ